MKLILLISLFILLTSEKCNQKKAVPAYDQCFKGRLEIKGGCMNYTISIVQGNMDTALYVPDWTDENTGKAYKKVFALESKCNFPATLNQGDEFYFTIDSTYAMNCAVCLMYYPVPQKKLAIRVITDPCTQ